MDNFIAFAEVAAAIIATMGLAMWLEWLALNGLLHLMPGQPDPRRGARISEARIAASPRQGKPGPTDLPALTVFPH
ncbi:MAG: hypothetical protein ABSA57_14615 [Candidatus Acidiferrales bacterium]|jgi:hypothetical protein